MSVQEFILAIIGVLAWPSVVLLAVFIIRREINQRRSRRWR